MSITPVSGLKMRGGRLREGPSLPLCTGYSQELRHRGRFEVWCWARGSVGSEMEPDGTCGEIVHLFVISVNPQNVKSGSVKIQ